MSSSIEENNVQEQQRKWNERVLTCFTSISSEARYTLTGVAIYHIRTHSTKAAWVIGTLIDICWVYMREYPLLSLTTNYHIFYALVQDNIGRL